MTYREILAKVIDYGPIFSLFFTNQCLGGDRQKMPQEQIKCIITTMYGLSAVDLHIVYSN